MEKKDAKKKEPKLWYWSQPQDGLSVEECEEAVRQMKRERTIMIAFV